MKRYLGIWNSDEAEVIDADTLEEADNIAYEIWKGKEEKVGGYAVTKLNKEIAEKFGFEWEEK